MPDIPYKQLIDENGDSFYPVCGGSSFSVPVPVAKVGRDPLDEESGNPLQYSCLKSPMNKGAWRATVQRVAESDKTEMT